MKPFGENWHGSAKPNMSDPGDLDRPRPETDKVLTERNRGEAEVAVLGNNPFGSMTRIVLAVVVFVVLFGTIFFLMQN
ncbi:MAG: hypothetical protein JWP99_547 [Devosia sp.]|nr:hypothetical protein [Devosia sp.]